jgi:curli production assembly/transport component CsgF
LAAAPARGTDLVYRPVNPNFGGDPLNGPNLLNSANAQNGFKDPNAGQFNSPFSGQSTVQQFADTLQRAILGRIASAISGSVVDASGNLIPGTVTVGSLTVTIVDLGTTWRITTLDTSSGQSTVFEVPK